MKRARALRRGGACSLMLALIGASPASATLLNVPGDYATIEEAFNAASDGDEIVLADGTHTGGGFYGLTFSGKRVTLRSENGPAACTIDACYYAARRMLQISGSADGTRLEGITFTRAREGALYCYGDTTITNCRFVDNQLYDWGGAINYNGCSVIVRNCTFIDNYASIGGGAFSGYQGTSWIEGCLFLRNTGTSGGAIQISESNATVVNCVFIENAVWRYGGAIRNDNPNSRIVNCTFLNNHAPWGGSALVARAASTPTMSNCIMWGDEELQVHQFEDAVVTLDHCDISTPWEGPGVNNFSNPPCFVDPLGPDGVAATEDDNLRLQPNSPCLNIGDNSAIPPGVDTDLDGNQRVAYQVVDLGAYELGEPPCPGDVDGDGDRDQSDLAILLVSYELPPDHPLYQPEADINGDGAVDQQDLGIVLAGYEIPCP
jgi:Right handed beta helix region/Dockerin type I domain